MCLHLKTCPHRFQPSEAPIHLSDRQPETQQHRFHRPRSRLSCGSILACRPFTCDSGRPWPCTHRFHTPKTDSSNMSWKFKHACAQSLKMNHIFRIDSGPRPAMTKTHRQQIFHRICKMMVHENIGWFGWWHANSQKTMGNHTAKGAGSPQGRFRLLKQRPPASEQVTRELPNAPLKADKDRPHRSH